MRRNRTTPIAAAAVVLLAAAPAVAQSTEPAPGGFSLRSLFGLAPAAAPAAAAEPIAWSDDASAAQLKARQSRRPIVAYITADKCGFCRKMERETWTDAAVAAEVTSRFVPLKLHAERDRELVQALKVRAYPTTIVFTADGKALGGAAGYLPPEKLAALLTSSTGPAPQAMAPRPAPRY